MQFEVLLQLLLCVFLALMDSTVRDVARRANVSISTVSRVLNNSAPVSEIKKRRVLKAIKELQFTPNPVARSLLGQATGTIGAILPHITGEFFADLLSGLDGAIKKHDYLLMVSASRRLERDFITALRGMYKRVDGLIIMAPELSAERVLTLIDSTIPVVFLNTHSATDGMFSINFDNRDGMVKIAQHIAERGHTLAAFIGGPSDAFDAQERQQGFLETVPDGLRVICYPGDFTFESGYKNGQKILGLLPRPTVIVAANDLSALGAMRALLENGVSVPDEIAVTGFDGTRGAHFSTPSLTTVNVPIGELAANAVRILVSQLSEETIETHPEITPDLELIVRESSLKQYHPDSHTVV